MLVVFAVQDLGNFAQVTDQASTTIVEASTERCSGTTLRQNFLDAATQRFIDDIADIAKGKRFPTPQSLKFSGDIIIKRKGDAH